jgi:hypothetical protein
MIVYKQRQCQYITIPCSATTKQQKSKTHRAKKELKNWWPQKSVMIKTIICNSYAMTQKHFATTVLSSESYDSNLPLVIVTLILMDSV